MPGWRSSPAWSLSVTRPVAAVPPHARAIAAALAERRPAEFARAIQAMDTGNSAIPFAERAGILGRVELLAALYLAISETGGLHRFIDTPEGNSFRNLVASCRVIGAPKTERLLAAFAALYPRGRVPVDEGDRLDATLAIEQARTVFDPVDPFASVQRAHRGAPAELIARLRTYVRKHAAALATGLAKAERDRMGRAAAFRAAKKGTRGKSARQGTARGKATPRSATRATRTPGKQVLHVPAAVAPTYPARIDVDEVIAGLTALDRKGWLALVAYWATQARQINAAKEEVGSAKIDVIAGRRFPLAKVKGWIADGFRIWAPVTQAAERLPETVRLNGKTVPFRAAAGRVENEIRQTV